MEPKILAAISLLLKRTPSEVTCLNPTDTVGCGGPLSIATLVETLKRGRILKEVLSYLDPYVHNAEDILAEDPSLEDLKCVTSVIKIPNEN